MQSSWRNVIGGVLWAVMLATIPELHGGDDFRETIQPFTQKYCVRCHNSKRAKGELNFAKYTQTVDVTKNFRRWTNIIAFIQKGEMPPKDAKQPSLKEREAVVSSITAILLMEARKHAGDPGVVLTRRLSRTEYDNSIRDLTGVDIRPTRDFPPDPAAGEGFNNTGEALTMSPSLLKKYLAAAQEVSHHLVLRTDGVMFAPFPVTSYNERKKLTEQAIIDFYRSHEVRVPNYIEAAWRYRHRGAEYRPITITAWAKSRNLSGKYLAMVWETLNAAPKSTGYLKQLGDLWNALPPPNNDGDSPSELAKLNQFLEFARRKLGRREEALIRSNAGNWPISHLKFRAETAAARDQFDPGAFKTQTLLRFDRIRKPRRTGRTEKGPTLYIRIDPAVSGQKAGTVVLRRPVFSKSNNLPRNEKQFSEQNVETLRSVLERFTPDIAKRLSFGKSPDGKKVDADSFVISAPAIIEIPLSPAFANHVADRHLLVPCELDDRNAAVLLQVTTGQKPQDQFAAHAELLVAADSPAGKQLAASAEQFCRTFPNRFFYVDNQRGLAAGFHLVEGYFRDDHPLVQNVLDEMEIRELDRMWRELNFITASTETLLRGFVWFERAERHVLHDKRFDFLRPEDPKLVEAELLGRFERIYLGKMGVKLIEGTSKPEKPNDRYEMIHGFFEQIRKGLAEHRRLMTQAEECGLKDVEKFASRAYRRPLRADEIASLESLHKTLRKQGKSVEDSLRGVLIAVLMSPEFCYRITETPAGTGAVALSDRALASRLSYFLWSSLPDEPLLKAADQSGLQKEDELLKQTHRMLKDSKMESFAREFLGQWLRYRDYLSKDAINATAFPGYTEDLRKAMAEEPVHVVLHLIQNDRPITDLLNADFTYVNGVLARHYGGEIATQYRQKVATWTNARRKDGDDSNVKPEDVWHRVDGLRKAGRGGLFGMGVVLTKNSKGERTSPVKRGFWVVHHLLGQHFPPPPADVPELPTTEKLAKKSIRELMSAHTANASCALCHVHFDGLGLALEGFDPIGRMRTKDLAGRPIDNVARLPNGETGRGVSGLIDYVEKHRRRDFVRTFCRKFLGYSLGRSVLLSDQPLLDDMEKSLEKNGYRFSVLFETVVRSPQFRKQRGREFVTAKE